MLVIAPPPTFCASSILPLLDVPSVMTPLAPTVIAPELVSNVPLLMLIVELPPVIVPVSTLPVALTKSVLVPSVVVTPLALYPPAFRNWKLLAVEALTFNGAEIVMPPDAEFEPITRVLVVMALMSVASTLNVPLAPRTVAD